MQCSRPRVGDAVDDIDTPALVVDLDAFERNLDLMAQRRARRRRRAASAREGAQVPGHRLAQIERGAVGICCQKVGEAEAFVAAGIRDVLVTNEIVGAAKLARLAALAQDATIGVLVDDAANVRPSRRRGERGWRDARRAGRDRRRRASLRRRAGRAGGRARAAVARTPALALPRPSCVPRRRAAPAHARRAARGDRAARAAFARETKAAIEAAGIACPVVTGAGTGTWQHERDSGVYTELQPGSYVFMDADYHRNALAPDEHHFEQSLFVRRDGDERAGAASARSSTRD